MTERPAGTAGLTWADVLDLVARFEATGYTETRVELPGFRLYVSRSAADPTLVEVRAPVPGIFYRRPAPGHEPFVAVGTPVEAGTTVAIVEVMKLMTHVTAGTAGRIAEVCAADGDLVDEGRALFRIEPGPAPS